MRPALVTLGLAILLSPALLAADAPRPTTLDGSKFMVKVTPDAEAAKKGEKAFDDTLVFEGGKMTATACTKFGFGPASYTAMLEKDTTTVKSELTSAAEGKAAWSGKVMGGGIRGTLAWTKKDGAVMTYKFEGKVDVPQPGAPAAAPAAAPAPAAPPK